MLVDLAHAVGGYLLDVFAFNFDWWVLLGFVAQAMFTMRFVVQWIASERAGQKRDPDRVLVFLDRRRRAAARLRALSARSGLHRRAGLRRLRLCAQSLFRTARAQRALGGEVKARAKTRKSRAQGRRSGRLYLRARCESATPVRPAPMSSPCDSSSNRTGSQGFRIRPTNKPIPNSCRAFRNACTAFSGAGLSTRLNNPLAPRKSRFQIA